MPDKLDALLNKPLNAPVYYLASTEAEPLREGAARLRRALLAAEDADAEATVIDGPSPDLGAVVAAAGAVSFFGTRRVVELRELSPSSMSDKDAAELAGLFGEVASAVLLVTALYRDKNTAKTKKAKQLADAAAAAGVALELQKPTRADNIAYVKARAEALGASFAPGAAEDLLELTGEDRPLLANETARLAAFAGYGTIERELVGRHAARSVEADVFALVGGITAGRARQVHGELTCLLAARHEPLAISGALAGAYVDMLRVRAGIEAKKNLSVIAADIGYKGSTYRLQRSRDGATAYSTNNLHKCVLALAELDRRLKSSALGDRAPLLQATVGELMLLRDKR